MELPRKAEKEHQCLTPPWINSLRFPGADLSITVCLKAFTSVYFLYLVRFDVNKLEEGREKKKRNQCKFK